MFLKLILIALMIWVTAIFVAAEFALVKVRGTKLESLEEEGVKNAKLARHMVHHLDDYLSACQLGITLTTLIIGGIGETTVSSILEPLIGALPISRALSLTISIILAYIIITFIEVVVGELLPKSYSIVAPEKVTLATARPLHIFYKCTAPFIALLNKSANSIGKLFGIHMVGEANETLSEEELLQVAKDSFRKGEINKEEYQYLSRIFDFDERQVKEIMTNRLEMHVVEEGTSVSETIGQMVETGYSRFPVIRQSKDTVIGYVTLSSMVKEAYINADAHVETFVEKPIFVMENSPIKIVLKMMQVQHKHLAIVVDEYGGTAGIVTIEDIVEELVGDIQDEVDMEIPLIRALGSNHYIVEGGIELDDFTHLLKLPNLEDPHGNVTLSGYFTSRYGHEVVEGFTVSIDDVLYTVLEMSNESVVDSFKVVDIRNK
ncbi:hemolysin family protein [Vagococcus vulneris]|uniref:Hemolysin n=1 Tax=Vagococcus vulneris TaxID=1977869 RepID=A0A430A1Q5_9ENTE|nr:hemolysin family protein [Vagococcus vulneris]RSU00294.1 hemolysin [Vagococcus vulneris]